MKFFPKSSDEQCKALLRILVFLELVAVSLYALADLGNQRELGYLLDRLKLASGVFALLLSLAIWGLCALRSFTSKRYGLAYACLVAGLLQVGLLLTLGRIPRAKVRAI